VLGAFWQKSRNVNFSFFYSQKVYKKKTIDIFVSFLQTFYTIFDFRDKRKA